ncbi:lipid-binding SYLF domain-containing protein [Candidatus Accumulibacter aalborgensis]|nr:lipid-binding SYLF domain-containing protein [Candidatus Accumulibacter aalborgensis]
MFLIAVLAALVGSVAALAADRTALERDAQNTYQKLIARVSGAKALSRDAVAVLVFPKITKAGLVIGGQYGDGVLFKGGKAVGFYNTSGASYGLQAGAQQYGYAMFFMNEKSLNALTANDGFEVGVGPSIVVVDQGMGKSLTSTTAKDDIYAFIFSQKGLMAGLGLQGNKITRLSE